MAILITSPGLVTTGTEGADDIRFVTGGLTANGSVVNALGGNDTIFATDLTVGSAASIGAGPEIYGGGGADSILFDISGSTNSANNAVINGGAGGDTITVSGENNVGIGSVIGANGGDLITLQGTATYSGIGAGAGKDTIGLSGTTTIATGALIGLGAGNDVFSAGSATVFLTGAGIQGGGGSDTITIASGTLAGSGSYINGDSTANGGAADSITVNAQGAATIVRGKGGADTIGISTLGQSAVVAGNAGGDVIVVSGFATEASINGGQGADSIVLDTVAANGATGTINAGGGKDTIFIGGTIGAAATSGSGVVINGGAGVDSIAFSGTIGANADLGGLQLGSMSDSTLNGYDTVDLSGLDVGNNATIDVVAGSAIGFASSASSIGAAADIAAGVFATGAAITGSVTNGYMTFTGQGSATLAAAAGYADAATRIADGSSEGRSVLFTNGGNDFLFIQGGAAGTDDDALIKFSGASGSTMAAGTITLLGDA